MSGYVKRQLFALLGMLLICPGVLAHNSLTGSEPKADSTVTTAPETLVLEFSDSTWLNEVTVTDQQGNDVVGTIEEAASPYSTFSVPLLPDAMADGEYTVSWTVEGLDTHIITGEFTFALEQQGEPASKGEDGSGQ